MLTGHHAPDRGHVRFAGEDITGLPPRRIAQKGISRSFQVMNLFNEYSALDNVLIALPSVRRQGFNVVRDLGANRAAQDEAAAVLARVGLTGKEHAPARVPGRPSRHARAPRPPRPARHDWRRGRGRR